jgi:phytanoyl-CoA hydroxylase
MTNATNFVSNSSDLALNELEVASFAQDGYLICRGLADTDTCARINQRVDEALNPPLGPLEFEADVHYPGAPSAKQAQGGYTPRRLLHAYTREKIYRDWATSTEVVNRLRQLMSTDRIDLSQNHHNCVMTKCPGFSSLTSWHQDVRYWSFDRPELVSVWLALGDEFPQNGGLSLIPGSHLLELERGRLDAKLFLRTDLAPNRQLIESAVAANLQVGDVLFFHCRTFHAAGRNEQPEIKKSLVYTYRCRDNQPIPHTRSAVYEDIPII